MSLDLLEYNLCEQCGKDVNPDDYITWVVNKRYSVFTFVYCKFACAMIDWEMIS
jgi:hypothetical protein